MTIKGTPFFPTFGLGRNFYSVAILYYISILWSLADRLKKNSDQVRSNPLLYLDIKNGISYHTFGSTKIALKIPNTRKLGLWICSRNFEDMQKVRAHSVGQI